MSPVGTSVVDWLKRYRLWLVLLGLAALVGYTLWSDTQRVPVTQEQLGNIQDLDQLRTQFNRDAGHPRLILLLSPT
jgi:hypothetical protein